MNQKKKVALLIVGVVLIIAIAAMCLLLFSKNEKIVGLKKSFISSIQRQQETVSNGSDTATISESEADEEGITTDTSNWDLSKVNKVKVRFKPEASGEEEMQANEAVEETEYVYVPVPKGYTASDATGENAVNTGLVIYEGEDKVNDENVETAKTSRNQWVWVPVKNPSRIYEVSSGKMKSKLYDFTTTGTTKYSNNNYEPGVLTNDDMESSFEQYGLPGMTKDRLLKELQKQFESTIKSIKKYGGFYIGRYETGDLSKTKVAIKAMNKDNGSITWYKAYEKLKYLGANKNVQTSMIWGNLWDETLQWLVDSGAKTAADIKDSSNWGNHYDSDIQYKDASGNNVTKKYEADKIPTGSSENCKANNIYDLAGNYAEWTLEVSNESKLKERVNRGGGSNQRGSYESVSHRGDDWPYWKNGVRAYFYIK